MTETFKPILKMLPAAVVIAATLAAAAGPAHAISRIETTKTDCSAIRATLIREGAERLHIYTLNLPDLTYQLCQALGVEARPMKIAAGGGCA